MAQPLVGLYYVLVLSMPFFGHAHVPSILFHSTLFYSLQFHFASFPFDSILFASILACDL